MHTRYLPRGQFREVFGLRRLHNFRQTCTDDQNIACAKFNSLIFSERLNLFHRDAATVKWMANGITTSFTLCCGLGLVPRFEVDQNSSGNDTAGWMPVIQGWHGVLSGGSRSRETFLGNADAVVGKARFLVLPVHKAITLTAHLSVEMNLVIPPSSIVLTSNNFDSDLQLRSAPLIAYDLNTDII